MLFSRPGHKIVDPSVDFPRIEKSLRIRASGDLLPSFSEDQLRAYRESLLRLNDVYGDIIARGIPALVDDARRDQAMVQDLLRKVNALLEERRRAPLPAKWQ